jgi:hypothetical protein
MLFIIAAVTVCRYSNISGELSFEKTPERSDPYLVFEGKRKI